MKFHRVMAVLAVLVALIAILRPALFAAPVFVATFLVGLAIYLRLGDE